MQGKPTDGQSEDQVLEMGERRGVRNEAFEK